MLIPMSEGLLDHDHKELDKILDSYFGALSQSNFERAYHYLDFLWARLGMHIRAEHVHLFPALLASFDVPESAPAFGPTREEAQAAIAQLRKEHDSFINDIWAALKPMRAILADADASHDTTFFREKIEEMNESLQAHNRREEAFMYRWVEGRLSPAQLADLHQKMQTELEKLPPRFREPSGAS